MVALAAVVGAAPPLLDVVYRMIEKEVPDRYQSMEEVAAALEKCARTEGVSLSEGKSWLADRTGVDPLPGELNTRTL